VTDQTLQIGEKDLWICAQARERNLILVTADEKMDRIRQADPTVRLRQIN
jgi:predicted nucleic acid-binding protein